MVLRGKIQRPHNPSRWRYEELDLCMTPDYGLTL